MSVTGKLALTGTGQNVISKTITASDESIIELSFTVGTSVTDQQQALAVDVSEIKLLWISSDNAVTMEWNDTGGTQGAIAIPANEPVVWWPTQATNSVIGGTGFTVNPLVSGANDITTSYWTNGSGSLIATVNMFIIVDASP